jgi:hypothetical protein
MAQILYFSHDGTQYILKFSTLKKIPRERNPTISNCTREFEFSKSEMEHGSSRDIQYYKSSDTCMIAVGNARNTNADSWRGTQLTPSSASRSPTGQ